MQYLQASRSPGEPCGNQHAPLTSDFHFSQVYFVLYFYIPVHFQLGIPKRKSIFLQAFSAFGPLLISLGSY